MKLSNFINIPKMNIEIKKRAPNNVGRPFKYVVIDGQEDTNGYCDIWTPHEGPFKGQKLKAWHHPGEEAYERLAQYSVADIKKEFAEMSMFVPWPGKGEGEYLQLKCIFTDPSSEKTPPFCQVSLRFQLEEWSMPWSAKQYFMELQYQIRFLDEPAIEYWEEYPSWTIGEVGLICHLVDDRDLHSMINHITHELIPKLDALTTEALLSKTPEHVITTGFRFPKETETYCKQYLIYFAQFLADLGIEADTEVRSEINQTLFTVIPKDKNQSLGQIKDALAAYLKAPELEDFQMQTTGNNVAALQWQANVMHLKSQLQLTQAVIETKDATIKYLQLSNYQLQQIVGTEGSPKDSEEIIPGIVSVKDQDLEGSGFTLHIPELIRRLKRKFAK
jgi:hypothetical protein